MFFSPQILCLEVLWVFSLLPFQICECGATSQCGVWLIMSPLVLGLFAFESEAALCSRFAAVYKALVVGITLSHAVLPFAQVNELLQVFLYTAGIVSLAVLTQLSCDDQDIWTRDIDSSPCPFPFQVLLVYAFPCTVKYFPGAAVELRTSAPVNYCPPGCPCQTKPTEASGLGAENADYTEGTRSSRYAYLLQWRGGM